MDTALTYAGAQIDTNANGKIEHLSFKKISGGATLNGPFDFAGVGDQYFGAVFMPDHPDDATVVTFEHKIDIAKVKATSDKSPAVSSKELPVLGAALGSTSGHTQTSIFVGPKAINVLKNIHTADGGTLEPLLDFGFFGPIGKYLFLGLRAVHSWIAPHDTGAHNYSWGWAIIIFTIMINLVLLPLRVQGMKSALKMQRIQPQIDAIKAKYKNPKATDPKAGEMNAEVMAHAEGQRRQHARRLHPVADPAPAALRLLHHDDQGRRAPPGALLLAARSLRRRPLPHPSHPDGRDLVPRPVLHALTRRRPAAAEDDGLRHAHLLRLSHLAVRLRPGALLERRQHRHDRQQLVMNQTSLGREMKEIAAKRARRKAAAPKPGQRAATTKTIQGRK